MKAAEGHFSVVLSVLDMFHNGVDGNSGRLQMREMVNAGADTREGDAAKVVFFCDFQSRIVAGGKQCGLVMLPALPDRAYGMNDFLAGQVISIGHFALTGFAATQCHTFL